MSSSSNDGGSHGQFLLLLSVTGVNAESIDHKAQHIHDEYMATFGHQAAFTVGLFELGDMVADGNNNISSPVSWTHVVRYFGPVASVAWLRHAITQAFEQTLNPPMQTFKVTDITGRY